MKMKKELCIIMAAISLMSLTACSSAVTSELDGMRKDIGYGTEAAPEAGPAADGGEGGETPPTNRIEGEAAPDDITYEGEDTPATLKGADGTDEAPAAEPNSVSGDTEISTTDPVEPEPPQSGQLTAGEWNDNDNWGFFMNLCNSGKIDFPSYGLDPRTRTMVTVNDSSDAPVVNASVSLCDEDGKVLWTSVTDKNGTAYLFCNTSASPENPDPQSEKSEPAKGAKTIVVKSGGKTQSYDYQQTAAPSEAEGTAENPQARKSSSYEAVLVFNGGGTLKKKLDIMFIVDATGSMSDEMLFLQSEFSDIAKEVSSADTRFAVNFYRDEGDDYVTKCSDFTTDTSSLQSTLSNETADGGGDLPEAVAQILDESVNKASWRDDAVKLAFLIFDAPPHAGTDTSIIASVKAAAEKGIRIIPVVSSNSDRNTELFGRAVAIETGATYVFLTDDSRIGESHLEPIIGKYEVEKLYDLIIRLINSYKQ